ncbi:hypothetical protein BJ742DRAFT_835356 [Cladochytrium replicatum]|nr:hypothetical protein BJ742DRAFT_835356 [Cladochytrium replicatum]
MAPKVLVLGGVGFIGRNFVTYLVENDLASSIRVADKVLPATAYLSERCKKAFEDPRVEFRQANLVNPASCEKVFTREDRTNFDYVFNLAAETKYSQSEEVYEEKIFQLTLSVAREAQKRNVACFVEASTAQVYEPDKKPSTETSKVKPWTVMAKHKLRAEEELKKLDGLNYIIVRPATVYGPGDVLGITPRLIIAAVYKNLNEEMKMLWSKDLKLNTVHVVDVCRAIWHLAATVQEKGGRTGSVKRGDIFNLCDKGDSDQGSINNHIQTIFGIETGFQGTAINLYAKMNLEAVTEDVNDKHLQPWSDLCKSSGVVNTPLTPYLDKELLKENFLSVDGSKIEREFGFSYSIPEPTSQNLKQVVDEYVAIGIWPAGTTK